MRHLAQIFYFLGTLPGLRFFTKIGSYFARIGAIAQQSGTAKNSFNKLSKKDEKEESGEAKDA